MREKNCFKCSCKILVYSPLSYMQSGMEGVFFFFEKKDNVFYKLSFLKIKYLLKSKNDFINDLILI